MNHRKLNHVLGQSVPESEMTPEEISYRLWEKMVCDVFIKAVLAHDRKAIIELADAAAFFKGKLDDDFVPADPIRLKLLKIKDQPRAFPRTLTIRQIAEQVYDKKILPYHASDGFSALRRLCKQLKIAIRPSRKTKKK